MKGQLSFSNASIPITSVINSINTVNNIIIVNTIPYLDI